MKSLDRSHLHGLSVCTHERTESHFQHLNGVDFWAISQNKHHKQWNTKFAPIPTNYHLLYNRVGQPEFPLWLDFDFVLSQSKFGQFQTLAPLAEQFQLPMISVEHTCVMPPPMWNEQQVSQLRNMRGTANVFISEWSKENWGFVGDDVFVIEHTVDSNLFTPGSTKRENKCLVVANDLIGRDYVLNWKLCQKIASKIPTRFVGDTPGLSKSAESVNELIEEYRAAKIFLNTAPLSPIPTSMLEAMSCGCIPVSVATCAIPSYIKDGENGLLANDEKGILEAIRLIMNDNDLAEKLSANARKTIIERCNINRWVKQWHCVINYVLSH